MGVGAAITEGESVGDVDFDAWVSAREPGLLRFAYLVIRDAEEARDAVQDALTSACARWSRIAASNDPEAYVRRMIVNAHVSWWRKFRRREVPAAEVWIEEVADGADAGLDDEIWRLCGELPSRQRSALVLRFYEGLSYAESAAVLHCTEATARSHVHRALATLRARLDIEERT